MPPGSRTLSDPDLGLVAELGLASSLRAQGNPHRDTRRHRSYRKHGGCFDGLMAIFFFDGDQTLWDFQAMMRRALTATIGELRRLRPGIGGDLGVEAFVTDRE